VDFAVVSEIQRSSAFYVGATAGLANVSRTEQMKIAKYAELGFGASATFIPAVASTLGAWGNHASPHPHDLQTLEMQTQSLVKGALLDQGLRPEAILRSLEMSKYRNCSFFDYSSHTCRSACLGIVSEKKENSKCKLEIERGLFLLVLITLPLELLNCFSGELPI
jgi:hypothetical protein